eukprot:3383441-Alexandrium_andersonii.AAC.1
MSASLVGSEMCIRDRERSDRATWGAASRRPKLLRESIFAHSSPPVGRRTCLLYTSDAADDM